MATSISVCLPSIECDAQYFLVLDPVTRGHENVVLRGLNLFDEVIVAVGQHSTKKGAFPVEERLAMLRETFADQPRIKVMSYTGLTSEFCHKVGATAQLRGVRNGTDFDYEKTIAQMTRQMHPDVDTVVLLTDPAFTASTPPWSGKC